MGKYFTRMKELDHYDHQFSLKIDYAVKNEQTGQIEYCVDNEILANYEEIDKRKGRILIGWLNEGDLPVYCEIGKEKETMKKIDQIQYYKYQIYLLENEIREKNVELGWNEEKNIAYY